MKRARRSSDDAGIALAIVGAAGAFGLAWLLAPRPTEASTGCRCVAGTAYARRRALLDLVRPNEVAHLIADVSPSFAVQEIEAWMVGHFASRRFRYEHDPRTCDRWCPPRITIARGAGDCDDWAIVACSMLRAAGVRASVVLGSYCDQLGCEGHAWVEGVDMYGAFLLEGTTGRVSRGRRPSAYRRFGEI